MALPEQADLGTHICHSFLPFDSLCCRRAFLREPVQKMEFHRPLRRMLAPRWKACGIQSLLRVRERYRQEAQQATILCGFGSLPFLLYETQIARSRISTKPRNSGDLPRS